MRSIAVSHRSSIGPSRWGRPVGPSLLHAAGGILKAPVGIPRVVKPRISPASLCGVSPHTANEGSVKYSPPISRVVVCNKKPPEAACAEGLPDGLVASRDVARITVDSGACDAIVPPCIFQHTPAIKHEEFGRTYAACGGETVINLGVKNVKCLLSSGDIKSIPFQVGDKIISRV